MQNLELWLSGWGVWQWAAFVLMCAVSGFVIARLYEIFAVTEYERTLKKFVVVVRRAAPGEFGGFVSMQSIRRTDEWRIAYAESAAEAVNQVLCAGEVPVVWMSWESISWYRKMVLSFKEVWRFVAGV